MTWGCVSAVDSNGRTIWIADAHRGDGKPFVVRADEKADSFSGTRNGDSRRSWKQYRFSNWLFVNGFWLWFGNEFLKPGIVTDWVPDGVDL